MANSCLKRKQKKGKNHFVNKNAPSIINTFCQRVLLNCSAHIKDEKKNLKEKEKLYVERNCVYRSNIGLYFMLYKNYIDESKILYTTFFFFVLNGFTPIVS